MDTVPNVDPELLPLLKNLATKSQINSMLSVAIYTAYLYNLISTFRDEVDFVWGHGLSFGSAIYFASRYLAAISLSIDTVQVFVNVLKLGGHQVSVNTGDSFGFECFGSNGDASSIQCFSYNVRENPANATYIIGLMVLFLSMALLQLRTIVLYGNPRRLFITFGVLDLLLLGAFILISLLARAFDPLIWLPLSLIELITLGFSLWKTYKTYRSIRETNLQLPLLLKICLRDNTFYLVTILAIYIGGFVLAFQTEEFANAHFEVSVAISGTICPWLYVHLRKTQVAPALASTAPTMQFELLPMNRDGTQDDPVRLTRTDSLFSSGISQN